MKEILLHVHKDDRRTACIRAAIDLARAFDAHLTCIHVTPYSSFIAADPFGGVYDFSEAIGALQQEEVEAREQITRVMDEAGIAWDWEQYDGDIVQALSDRARLADLIVLGQPEADAPDRQGVPVAAGVAIHAGIPVLAMPADGHLATGGQAMIAWDGSAEAARALRGALPLLKQAGGVVVVQVDPAEGEADGKEVLAYLAHHGIAARHEAVAKSGRTVAATLRDAAAAHRADYLVCGAYGHSRLFEFILGGVTRDLMSGTGYPLLLAH